MSDAGFLIRDVLYPFAENFTFADAPLIREATGLEFEEFAERVDAMQPDKDDDGNPIEGTGKNDLLAISALVAVSISRAEPTWRRDRIVKFLAGVDVTSFDVQSPDVGPVQDDAGPPALEDSPTSSDESTTSPEDLQGEPV